MKTYILRFGFGDPANLHMRLAPTMLIFADNARATIVPPSNNARP